MLHHLLKTAATLFVTSAVALVAVGTTVAQVVPKGTAKGSAKTAAPATTKPLDLNKATAKELQVLPGIGEVTAGKIVAGRPYATVDDLAKAGVPARTIAGIRSMVFVAPPAAPAAPARKKGAAPVATAAGAVDLNNATEAQLETLPGVGPVAAKAIIAGRPYRSVDELERVKGIGKQRIATLRPLVTASAAANPAAAPAVTSTPTAPAATSPAAPTTPAKKKGAAPVAAAGGPVDLNKATEAQLETLPGVGPAIAKAIVANRPYTSVDDLERVRGISKQRIATLRPLVTPSGPATAAASVASTPATKSSSASAPTAKARTTAKPATGKPVNINTASKEELEALPGIGPVRAQAIIDGRPFKTIEDIMKVNGIKEGVFANLKGLISVE